MRALLVTLLLLGCGRPEAESPVDGYVQTRTITAMRTPPNIMVVLDRTVANAELKSRLTDPLLTLDAEYPTGLMTYPSDGTCSDARLVASLGGGLDPARDLAGITTTTDRSTTLALTAAATYLTDPNTDDFVLLVTGGADTCGGDALATVRELRHQNIKTIVVGYGVTAAADLAALDSLALVGGFARTCPNGSDSECGGSTCDLVTNVCSTPSYQVATAEEVQKTFDQIIGPTLPSTSCSFVLDGPTTPDRVSVYLDYQQTTEWQISGNVVTLTGSACVQVRRSSTQRPLRLDIRVVTRP